MQKINIDLIFKRYLAYNLHLKKLRENNCRINHKKQLINKYQSYISYIDNILMVLDESDAKFLKDVYLHHYSKEQLGYSISGYYVKYKTALNHFLDLYDQELIN